MAWEVEAKSRLSPSILPTIKKRVEELYKGANHHLINRRDLYLTSPSGVGFRLRYTQEGLLVTHKTKSRVKEGIEINRESEFFITREEAPKAEAFFNHLGYTPHYEKVKVGEGWRLDNLTIEIVEVPPLGHFIEIELIGDAIEASQRALQRVREELNIDNLPLEERYYSEMLLKEQ
ncbi:MAG: CYTH domain-containing protein [Sphaerochaetaceae bacterium]|jgi:predicted adenylyl cyclase CyaB|nr:CYTH domain-containing protein [Sphaerochaetaceae bacterium]HHU88837.1 CYTH domain-containing protein [Spirochaetales bacterium]